GAAARPPAYRKIIFKQIPRKLILALNQRPNSPLIPWIMLPGSTPAGFCAGAAGAAAAVPSLVNALAPAVGAAPRDGGAAPAETRVICGSMPSGSLSMRGVSISPSLARRSDGTGWDPNRSTTDGSLAAR